MFHKKMLPILLFVSILIGGNSQPSLASLASKSIIKGFSQPNATITVCSSVVCDYATIQEAIENANTLDTISLGAEIFTEAITIDKSLTLLGTGIEADGTIIQATTGSGVITVTSGITVEIDGVTIRNGNSNNNGGGILNHGALTIRNSLVTNNFANNGGGIANIPQTGPSKLIISNTTIEGNEAEGSGSGIYNFNDVSDTIAEVYVITSTIASNDIELDPSYGGGAANIAMQGTSILNVTNSTISENDASNGGGIFTEQGISGIAETIIVQSTFYGNSASVGSNVHTKSGDISLKQSILAYGQGGSDCHLDSGAIVTDNGFNLIQDGSCGFLASGDPQLGSLANNGGNTKTHALYNSSIALDIIPSNQCSTAIDQRGVARPYGAGCDSGAFESNSTELTFHQSVNNTYIKPGGMVTSTMTVDLIGPGITGGTISVEIPEELTILVPVTLNPPDSGKIGTPPNLAHDIVISANQMFTLTMWSNISEGLPAGTVLTQTTSFSSNETPSPQDDTITLNVINVPPIAVDDQGDGFLTKPDTELFYTASVLDNDIDLNGDSLTINGIFTDTLDGKITCNDACKENGIFKYGPNGQFDNIIPGQTATDSFQYSITDNKGGVGGTDAIATVTITLRTDALTVYLPLVSK